MEKLCGNSMIYNPYKRKAWAYLSLLFSFTIAMAYGLLTSQYSLTEVLILILLAIIDAISTYLVLRDPAYSTTIIINSNGISVTFSGKDSPIYIPWSNGVYINIRLENDYPGYKQLIRNRVLEKELAALHKKCTSLGIPMFEHSMPAINYVMNMET